MIEPFSAAYYLASMNVEEYNGDAVVMSHDMHEEISAEIYGMSYPVPLVVKINEVHTVVLGEGGLPAETLAIPSEVIEMFTDDVPAQHDVYIAVKERAAQIAKWYVDDVEAVGDEEL